VTVRSDTGAGITGRQRSLSAFAQQVADEVLPYVDALTPLRPNEHNPSELAATRVAVVHVTDAGVPLAGATVARTTGKASAAAAHARSRRRVAAARRDERFGRIGRRCPSGRPFALGSTRGSHPGVTAARV
jgi:hypothetical protein